MNVKKCSVFVSLFFYTTVVFSMENSYGALIQDQTGGAGANWENILSDAQKEYQENKENFSKVQDEYDNIVESYVVDSSSCSLKLEFFIDALGDFQEVRSVFLALKKDHLKKQIELKSNICCAKEMLGVQEGRRKEVSKKKKKNVFRSVFSTDNLNSGGWKKKYFFKRSKSANSLDGGVREPLLKKGFEK